MIKILMCRPEFFNISYEINPWMNVKIGINHDKAVSQWNSLESKLIELGVNVVHIPPVKGLPDMVFTANAGYIIRNNKTVVISTFKFTERQGEEIKFDEWFKDNNFKTIQLDNDFEGAGDALYLNDHLVVGHGHRTDSIIKSQLQNIGEGSVLMVELQDSHFYHLDTCFCPLQNGDYLIWQGAFSIEDIALIRKIGSREICVIEQEAVKFAANAVCIGKDVILPSGCKDTENKLIEAGYTPHPIEMSEFIKSGGACKCLTLIV
jgi:N-dimethylarginine dimethylaminohydrolase